MLGMLIQPLFESSPNPLQVTRFQGRDHLQVVLDQVHARKGEGLMLYAPNVLYTQGRTDKVRKLKLWLSDTVTFIKVHKVKKTDCYQCLQQNGATCNVRLFYKDDFVTLPTPGSQLKIYHSGISQKSQKFRYPFINFRLQVSPKHPKIKFCID